MTKQYTQAEIKEHQKLVSQAIQNNGRLAYIIFTKRKFDDGFRVIGISAPIQEIPKFVQFIDPNLINSICANDIN